MATYVASTPFRFLEPLGNLCVELHISTATIGEIQAGIELTREQDALKAAELEQWLGQVSETFNLSFATLQRVSMLANIAHAVRNRILP